MSTIKTSYTIADAAKMLKCSRDRVNRLVASGKLRTFTIPATGPYAAAVRIDGASLEELMEGKVPAETEKPPVRRKRTAKPVVDPLFEKWILRKPTR